MGCQNDHTTTIDVTPGAVARAALPKSGVLRFERQGAAMAGTPAMAVENGTLALHYADGASVYVDNI